MSGLRLIDPSDKLDFSIDWSDWLDSGVSIAGAAVWSIYPTGPILESPTNTTSLTTIFVSGCQLGISYELTCKITTDASVPQEAERSITLRCEER